MNAVQTLFSRIRGAVTALPRAFDISQQGRRLSAIPANTTAINTLILQYGQTAVARSRYLTLNNPYAASAKEAFVSSMVGGRGIRPSTLDEEKDVKAQVHDDWDYWCENADADGVTNLAGLQSQAASELFDAGEVFGIIDDTGTVEDTATTQVRLIPAEMLPYINTSTAQVAPGNYVQMGIEFDPSGRRVAYHFLTLNPNDITRVNVEVYQRIRVPAEKVFHLYRPIRAGQVRGIPFTLAALVATAMLDLYDDAELERKRVASLFAAFVTRNSPDEDHPLGKAKPVNAGDGWTDSGTVNNFTLRPGIVVDLLPGEDIKFSQPADSGGNYDAFEYRMLCRLAAGFGVPYAAMSGDLKAANYGSIRAGLVQFRRRIESMQQQNFIPMFLRKVWLAWLTNYTFRGLAPWSATDWMVDKLRRQHQKVKWLTPKWEWVDPLKDMQAEKLAVDNGFQSRFDTIETMGDDPDDTDRRIQEAQEAEDEFPRPLNTGQVPPPIPPEDGGTPPNPQEKPSAQ